jgi:hypothetical protein
MPATKKKTPKAARVPAKTVSKAKEENGFPSYCSMPIVPPKQRSAHMHPGRLELIVMLEDKWVNGTTLHYYFFDKTTDGRTVQFTDGSTEFRRWRTSKAEMDVVRAAFKVWTDVGIGITFEEVSKREDAEIRIGFERGDGAWSFVGRDIIDLNLGVNERTMNFGWDLTRSARELDTAVHEIGHTLGFPHEHQNPIAGIEWDEEAVFAALAAPPNSWNREKTFHNIIRKISPDAVQGSEWDPNSVMHYPFGPGLINKPAQFRATGITPAGGLSTRDRAWVKSFYPPLGPAAIQKLQPAQSTKLDILPGGQKNFSIEPSGTRPYKFQTFGPSDVVMVLFEQDGNELRYLAGNDDSGTDTNATFKQKLFSGRKYVLRARLMHSERPDETAIMMW